MSEQQPLEASSDPQVMGAWTTRWGLLLRMARQVAGLSLNELAARSGLSKGYLSKLESAHQSAANPSRATLAALVRALPSTLPLIQHMDPGDGLPTPATVLRRDSLQTRGHAGQHSHLESLAAISTNDASDPSEEAFLSGVFISWSEWELLLALMIFERSGLGPPTQALLARACGIESICDDPSLARLEKVGVVRRLPPVQSGGAFRYTLIQTLLDQQRVRRPADLFIYAAMNLLLRRGEDADQQPGTNTARTTAKKTVR